MRNVRTEAVQWSIAILSADSRDDWLSNSQILPSRVLVTGRRKDSGIEWYGSCVQIVLEPPEIGLGLSVEKSVLSEE
jgi:hypothetical protein